MVLKKGRRLDKLQIPEILRKKVVRCFGPRGREWLGRLPALAEECVAKWNLSNCRESPAMSYNYVCFADSPRYGQVVLKIGIPEFELNTEMLSINLYKGRNICRCHEQDQERGAMLLERISPGHDLTAVASSRKRIEVAAELVAALPVSLAGNPGLPTWSQLAQRTFAKLRDQNIAGEKMFRLAELAGAKIRELEESGRPRVLLHGDLNHWNILQGGDRWMAIDPKGQAGVACMEAGRFIINELEIAKRENPVSLMDEMTAVFSEKLGEPRAVIALVAFLDKVMGTSWKFEEHEPRDLTEDVNECEFLYQYYANLGI